MTEYRMAQGDTQVNTYLSMGFVPYGNPIFISNPGTLYTPTYIQAMVKYETTPERTRETTQENPQKSP